MRRREALAALAAAATAVAWPRSASAQRPGMRRIAVLMGGAEHADDTRVRIAAFRQGLAELGWRGGENVHIEYRWAGGSSELIQRHASELVALKPDVVLANGTAVLAAFKDLTTSIPIVFALAIDPVGLGFVRSLSRPGMNLTGFTFIDPELIWKWVGLLAEISPGLARAGLLFNPATAPFYVGFLRDVRATAPAGSIALAEMPANSADEIASVIGAWAGGPASGLMIGPGPLNQVQIARIAALATRERLPALSVYRPFATEGGLLSYGPDTADIFRRSASYVDRILKGADPAGLPVQQPTKFDLTVNLRTAKALGLTVPPALLARADEVIE